MTYKIIEVVPYNPAWPQMFEMEATRIRQALVTNWVAVHHIGSTSVPGLSAKESLDILCIVNDLKVSLDLQTAGYLLKGELNIPLRYFFSKNTAISKVNLHVVEAEHGFIALNLYFRDYLRENEGARRVYQKLKYQILEDPSAAEKTKYGFPKYTLAKDQFIFHG